MTDADLGTLTTDGDRCALTFVRRLAHPPEKVWRAVTEAEHLAAWFPQEIVGEWRAGARLRFRTGDDPADDFEGEVLACDPPRLLEMTWGGDHLRIELRPDGDGTVLTLVDRFDDLGKAARDAAGWHECLERLAGELDGTPPGEWGATWQAVHPRYVAALGPDATTVGPPT